MKLRQNAAMLVVLASCVGCVEPFEGSYAQLIMSRAVRSPCDMIRNFNLSVPGDWTACTGDAAKDRFTHYYELWATVDRSAAFRLKTFQVQPGVVPDELIALEASGALLPNGEPFRAAGDVAYSSLSADEQNAVRQRMEGAGRVFGITTYAPTLLDGKRISGDAYLGNYDYLQRPLNGTYYGRVNGAPEGGGTQEVGGAAMSIPFSVDRLDSLMITIEQRPQDRQDLSPSDLVLVVGKGLVQAEGAVNARMVNPTNPDIASDFLFYPSLGSRDYF